MSHLVLSLLVATCTTNVLTAFGGSCNFVHNGLVQTIGQCIGSSQELYMYECDPNTNSPVLYAWVDNLDALNITDCPDPTEVPPDRIDTDRVGECNSNENNCKIIQMQFIRYSSGSDCTGDISIIETIFWTDAANDICFPLDDFYVIANIQDTSAGYTRYTDDQCTDAFDEDENRFVDGTCLGGSLLISFTVIDDGTGGM